MAAVKTNVSELPESRVRVEAEVPPGEVQRRLEQAARALGREMRIPGFRKGKVPPPVILRRVGRSVVLDQAVRDSLAGWYADALDAARIAPVGDPDLDLGDLPGEGEPLIFSIEIGVRPVAELGDYKRLEVGRREPSVPDEAIDGEIEGLRERLAKLETVERPAAAGDFVVLDYAGSIEGESIDGGEGRDQLVELGSGRLVPGFEDQVIGVSAGEERTVTVTFPDEYGGEEVAGREATFAVTAKEVKAKVLPELDDELAVDAAGIDSLQELREDVRRRLTEADEREIETEFRQAVVDAAVAEAKLELPEAVVAARASELWDQTVTALGRQGISEEAYLRIAGKSKDELIEEAKPEAAKTLRREAVLAAVVQAERIEPSEEDLERALEHSAEHESTTPQKLLARLRKADRLEPLREDVAIRQAVDLMVESTKPISVEQAKARDKLWTPGKDEPDADPEAESQPASPGAGRLWTPGS